MPSRPSPPPPRRPAQSDIPVDTPADIPPEPPEASLRRPAQSGPLAGPPIDIPGEPPESPPRRAAFKTLGCKLNQAETEAVAAGFKTLGWQITPFGEPADAVVINSCTVTNAADRKSRAAMNAALRTPSAPSGQPNLPASAAPAPAPAPAPAAAFPRFSGGPGGGPQDFSPAPPGPSSPLVVMTGCYADGHRESLEADGRTYVVGNAHKSRIPQLVDAHFRGELLPGHIEADRDPFGYPVAAPVFRTRAMVKIQDGCENYCTFCIIPFVRGRAASRPLARTVAAVEEAAASGYREIVLTGVNMSRWEEGEARFADLVEACLDAPGDFRLRLGSIEPDRLNIPRLTELMSHPKITPHMHLCLQSGSEKILLAMRRQYTAAAYRSIAEEFRRRVPGFNLTTDIIVGFPGESEADFADTLDLCEDLRFGHIHTFPYSRRTGTRADRMEHHIVPAVAKQRAEAVRALSEKSKRRFRSAMIGSLQHVLAERADPDPDPDSTDQAGAHPERSEHPGQPAGSPPADTRAAGLIVRGLSANYVPVRFRLPAGRAPRDIRNRIFRVRIDSIAPGDDPDLLGTAEVQAAQRP